MEKKVLHQLGTPIVLRAARCRPLVSDRDSSRLSFLPRLRLPSQLQSVDAVGRYQFTVHQFCEQKHACVNNLPIVAVTAKRPRTETVSSIDH